MPPKRSTVGATAASTWRLVADVADDRQRPAAGGLDLRGRREDGARRASGSGSPVFAISATLAPSRAARSAISRPMPRLPPEMNRVLSREAHANAPIAGDVAPDDQRLHRLGALVGVDDLDVAHVADDVVLEQDAVAAEHVARLGDDLRAPCACC